jgi:bifunctional non-homologous end joining protein LigD
VRRSSCGYATTSIRRGSRALSGGRARPPAGDSEVDRVLQQLEDKRTTFQLAVGGASVKLTHLDRVYWPADPAFDQPALTKRDLLRYLARVSRFMLPHLADRPLTMIRMPEGIEGERFFQKHWEQARPEFVQTVRVFSESKAKAGLPVWQRSATSCGSTGRR